MRGTEPETLWFHARSRATPSVLGESEVDQREEQTNEVEAVPTPLGAHEIALAAQEVQLDEGLSSELGGGTVELAGGFRAEGFRLEGQFVYATPPRLMD